MKDKRCCKCKETKKEKDFNRDRNRPSGFMNKCRDCSNEIARNKRKIRKEIVIKHYGGKCVCCGERHIDFLTLDHINNDGHAERLRIFGKGNRLGGSRFYNYVIKNKFPGGLQILCWNCNCAKGFYGKCPHEIVSEHVGA